MAMIWATVADVRGYLRQDEIPAGEDDQQVQREVDRAVRSLVTRVLWWPELDDDERVLDTARRADVVAAVAETVRASYERRTLEASVGGAGLARLLDRGGSVTAGKLSVSGGSRSGGSAPARESAVPDEALDALLAAGLTGGSVASW